MLVLARVCARRKESVPVSMMLPPKVSRSTIAAHKCGAVNVWSTRRTQAGSDHDRGPFFAFCDDLEEQFGSAKSDLGVLSHYVSEVDLGLLGGAL